MTALVSIVSDNTICVSSINGDQHLYGKIAITLKRGDESLSSPFLLHKHSPYRETLTPKHVYQAVLRFYMFGCCHALTYEMQASVGNALPNNISLLTADDDFEVIISLWRHVWKSCFL